MSDGRLDLLPSVQETKRKSNNKRNDIQYLRALAIVGVLAFHLKPLWIPQGFLGVDIFFVISGYLMTAILNYGSERSLTFSSLKTFYLRRIKRIFPIYYLIIFLTLILCSPFLIDIDYATLKIDTIWSIAFSSNIQSMFNQENYFQRLDEYKFLLHTWSLSVEIQYYLIAPFLLYGISCLSFPIIATTIIIASSWSLQTFYPDSTVSFGFVLSRLWQFFIGTIVFYFEKSYIPVFRII
uniref:Acyltransferase 3 domain-containing protein n=1 Tax=Panagrolaimus sp. PS1159 TaxID=55785 RepID=A0AC35F0A8_9BILA